MSYVDADGAKITVGSKYTTAGLAAHERSRPATNTSFGIVMENKGNGVLTLKRPHHYAFDVQGEKEGNVYKFKGIKVKMGGGRRSTRRKRSTRGKRSKRSTRSRR